MDEFQMKQLCLDTAKAATELYDLIEEKGLTAPLDTLNNLDKLVAVLSPVKRIKEYYYRRNIQRMLMLGMSPATIIDVVEDATNNG